MGIEIERKFLARNDAWRSVAGEGEYCCQGYLNKSMDRTVRVRIMGGRGFLTIKGPSKGMSRSEFDYEIPLDDASQMLKELADPPLIEKCRYHIDFGGLCWSVDEFMGQNEGLILIELELESESQAFDLPDWAGQEVSGDVRYYNSRLAIIPYCDWKK